MVAILRLPPWIAAILYTASFGLMGLGYTLGCIFGFLFYFFKSPLIVFRFSRLIKRKWRRRNYTLKLQDSYTRLREAQRTRQASYRTQREIFGGGVTAFELEQTPSSQSTNCGDAKP